MNDATSQGRGRGGNSTAAETETSRDRNDSRPDGMERLWPYVRPNPQQGASFCRRICVQIFHAVDGQRNLLGGAAPDAKLVAIVHGNFFAKVDFLAVHFAAVKS